MRLNRLDLTRYGHFTDRVLDFGDAVPGQPDLHIVHGPNEAGKSTLLSAWLDLLFGIPARSDHAFLHDYKSMQIGAELALADGRHALVRTKGNKDTLTEGGAPVPQAVLAAALGGLDRAACAEMFALDAATMEQGGDLILSSQGRLGELLFAATAGLSELSRRLDALDAKGADFWKKSATKGRLKLMLADLARMDAELAALDVQAPDYARRRAAKAEAQAERDRLQALESAARARHDRAKARLDALPVLAEWGELTAELAPLEGLPDAPEDWADRVARLIRTDIDLTATARGTAQRLSDLTAGLVALTPDEAALALSDDPAFDDDLRARYRTARSDLPRRRDELAAALDRLAELSAACAVAPDVPAPDAATLDALDRLAADHGTLAERLRSARAEAGQAMAALDDAGGPLDDAADPDTAALRAALEPLRSADLMARTRLAAGEAAEAEARRDAALARLAPWQGDAAALRAVPVPSADTLARWRAELDAARAARADATARAADRAAEAARRAADRDGLAQTLGEAAPDTLAEARTARDAAWTAHRAALDAGSADRFATAMAAHDRAAEAQLARAGDLGRFHATRAEAATAELMSQRAEVEAAAAAQALAAARAQVAAGLAGLPVTDADDPLAGVADWLTARRQALDLADAADTAARSAARAANDEARARAALAAVLGQDAPLPTLAAAAQARLAEAEAEAARRAERRRLTAALAQRRMAEAAALRALDDWAARLAELLAVAPGDAPDAGRLRTLIPIWRGRATAQAEAAELRHRIAAMESDQQRFADAVHALAEGLGMAGDDPLALLAAASDRRDAARDTDRQRRALAEDLARTQAEARDQAQARARLDAETAEITGHLGAETLTEAQGLLTLIARRATLRASADRRAAQLLSMLGAPSLDDAVATLQAADADALRAELADAEGERAEAEQRLEAARQALFSARQALEAVPGDDRIARIDADRRALMLAIEDEAKAWLRQRAGVMATHAALDSYRATHRGEMMRRASDAFSTITGGAYTGLATQPGGTGEQLIALPAEGGSRTAAALSKGTRFQLYLALRIAGFHEWTAAHPPIPVIADDIMETFDDDRTRLALGALAEMSRGGQVIYLTHHRHVCELALQACPAARIVTL